MSGSTNNGVSGRLAKLVHLVRDQQWPALALSREENLAWVFGGRFHVNCATVTGIASLVVTSDGAYMVVDNIEQERLVNEEGVVGVNCRTYPWHDPHGRESSWPPLTVTDEQAESRLLWLRCRLDADQEDDAECGGRLLAEALEGACRECQPQESEYVMAARLAARCSERGIEPVVNLVGGEDRALKYRHLMLTDARMGRYGIVSIGGRYRGIVISATRMVHFGTVPAGLRGRYEAVTRVYGAFLDASTVGNTLGQTLAAGQQHYGREGYADEWRFHHQGGVAGYRSREMKAEPQSTFAIAEHQLLAWNPTIRGVKVEDTVLVHKSSRLQWLTRTPDTPTIEVSTANGVWAIADWMIL